MPDDFDNTVSTNGRLIVGGDETGTIDPPHDTDWFRITLQVGHTYQFDLLGVDTGDGTLRDPYMSIRNSNGARLEEIDDGGVGWNSRIENFTAPYTGTYYIAAGSNDLQGGTGTYRVTATQISEPIEDDHLNDPSTDGIILVGDSESGAIETLGDADWYRITLQAGYTYRFQMLGSDTGHGTLDDPFMRIRDSAGGKIEFDDNAGFGRNADIGNFIAPYSGTFYISVGSSDLENDIGTYQVIASQIAGPSASDDYDNSASTGGRLSVGEDETGKIEVPGDTDWFRVTLREGYTYQFDLQGVDSGDGTILDPYMSIRNNSSIRLEEANDGGVGRNARIENFTAPYTGTYYIAAGSNDLQSGTGTYRVAATQTDEPGSPQSVDVALASTSTDAELNEGEIYKGIIDEEPLSQDRLLFDGRGGYVDKDWIRIVLQRGHEYEFTADALDMTSGEIAFMLRRGSEAAIEATFAEGAKPSFSFDTTNQTTEFQAYYISVSAGGTNPEWLTATGTYQVQFSDLGEVDIPDEATERIGVRLPFAGDAVVTQTAKGITSHTEKPDNGVDPDFWVAAYDFYMSPGTPVLAVADGIIIDFDDSISDTESGNANLGNFVTILHDGGTPNDPSDDFYATYAHLQENFASSLTDINGNTVSIYENMSVSAGSLIAYSGSSGTIDELGQVHPHLHFQFSKTVFYNQKWEREFARATDEYDDLIYFEGVPSFSPYDTLHGASAIIDYSAGSGQTLSASQSQENLVLEARYLDASDLLVEADAQDVVVSDNASQTELIRATNYSTLTISGIDQDDKLTVGALDGTSVGNHTVYYNGLNGNDTLYGDNADKRIVADGGEGHDALFGGGQGDSINGDNGHDLLVGHEGNDTLQGDADNDRLFGENGNDRLVGGAGNDTAEGGLGNDQLWAGTGDLGDDLYFGGVGNDIIGGGAGDDILVGGDSFEPFGLPGSDTLFGGAGNDILVAGYGQPEYGESTEKNTLWAGVGNDKAFGDGGADIVGGGEGDDTLIGKAGDDTLYGGVGDGNDFLGGDAGNDKIFGGGGSDTIFGVEGNDLLYNGGGNDSVDGGKGSDTLWGGPGDDLLVGGDGADVFAFERHNGNDVILDFEAEEDSLDLQSAGFFNISDLIAVTTVSSSGIMIAFGDTIIFLENINLSDLTEANTIL